MLVCAPGLVYRRDAIDRLHVGEPHQLDLWRITERPMAPLDLEAMIAAVVEALLPGARWRALPASHPYTDDGREVEVLADGEWVELLECGLAHPARARRRRPGPATRGWRWASAWTAR